MGWAASVSSPTQPGDLKMSEKNILVLTNRLRSWCYEVLEDGPMWARSPAVSLIGYCNDFVEDLKDNVSWISKHERLGWDASCEQMREILFDGHEQIEFRGARLLPNLCQLCLELGRKAPPGWHARLQRDRRYRETFG